MRRGSAAGNHERIRRSRRCRTTTRPSYPHAPGVMTKTLRRLRPAEGERETRGHTDALASKSHRPPWWDADGAGRRDFAAVGGSGAANPSGRAEGSVFQEADSFEFRAVVRPRRGGWVQGGGA